jgi:hypothetical protein
LEPARVPVRATRTGGLVLSCLRPQSTSRFVSCDRVSRGRRAGARWDPAKRAPFRRSRRARGRLFRTLRARGPIRRG